jgi:hypothetical protein
MSQALQLSFQTNTDQARNAIAQLASTVAMNMVTIGNAMKSAHDNQDKFKSALGDLPAVAGRAAAGLLALGAVIVVFHQIGKSIEEAQEKLKELVAIGQSARNAGVGTDLFQRWTAHAQELNTTAEKLAETLEHARGAAEVSIGEGGEKSQSPIQARLDEHLKAGNVSQGDITALDDARTLEDKYRVILALLEKLGAESKAIAAFDIAGKFFGKDFEDRMRRGEDVVGKMRASLNGITQAKWPPEMIQRAEDLNREIERAKRGIAEAFLPLQRDIARGQLNLIQYTKEWWEFLERAAKTAGNLYQWFSDIGTKLDNILNSDFFRKINFIQSLLDKAGEAGAAFGAALGLRAEQYDPELMGEYGPGGSGAPTVEHPLDVKGDKSRGLPKKKEAESSDEVDTYIKQLQKSVEVLEAENRTFGQSNTVKAEAVDLERALAAARQRGTELTDKERETVKRLADQEGAAKDRAEALTRAQSAANEQAQLLGNSMISVLDKIGQSGVRATDVLKDMVKTLIKAVEQALLLGSGPFANLFGTQGTGSNTGGLAGLLIGGAGKLFGGGGYGASDYSAAAAAAAPGAYGPGFASGGLVGRDGTPTFIPYAALATAKRFDSGGGVAAILHQGEVVLNAAQQRNVAGSIGGNRSINITHAPVINGTGLSKEELFSVLQRDQKELHRNIGALMQDWQRRYA